MNITIYFIIINFILFNVGPSRFHQEVVFAFHHAAWAKILKVSSFHFF